MKHFPKTLLRLLVVIAVCATFGQSTSVRAADGRIGANVATFTVPAKLSRTDVEWVIQKSLIARKWTVQSSRDGEIVAHHEHGSNVATLTIRYDERKIDIYAVGQSRRGGLPMGWIENLKRHINSNIGTVMLRK